MSNRSVGLMIRCKTPQGWQRYPAAFGKNGRLRPGYALVEGTERFFEKARYEMRWYVGRKQRWKTIKGGAAEAISMLRTQETLLTARDAASAAGTVLVEKEQGRKNLFKEKQRWLDRLDARGKECAVGKHTVAIDDFLSVTELLWADQITEDAMLALYKALRSRGNSDRTLFNKAVNLRSWFKWMGLDVKAIIPDKPSYTKKKPEIYNAETLRRFFRELPLLNSSRWTTEPCGSFGPNEARYQFVLFQTLLKTGMRDREAQFLPWRNVRLDSKVLWVKDDSARGFTVKDREERAVPLSDDLVALLAEWKAERSGKRLVFGTKRDKPNLSMLRMLKDSARRYGLNCGECEGCATTEQCYRWFLHKFRATYTTRLLRSGVDPRTVMAYTGHADLATVLRYLAPEEDAPMQAKISSIQWY